MPTPRAYVRANVVNGKIYLIGGLLSNWAQDPNVSDSTEVYDPATDSWTTKASIPTAVYGYASAVIDNKIHVLAGGPSESDLNQIYDPETDAWSSGKSIPITIHWPAAAATTGMMAPKRIYLIGGMKGLDAVNLNYVYNPETDAWTTGTPMLTSRNSLGAAVVNDVLYAIGGGTGAAQPPSAKNEQYTPFGYGTIPPDTTSPTISIVSPENKTYNVNNVSLTFTINELTSWIGYSLDDQANVTITGNTALTGLSYGSHKLTVYAADSAGNSGASQTIHFSITEPFPTTLIVATTVIIVIAMVGAALLVYFRKVKKTTGKAE